MIGIHAGSTQPLDSYSTYTTGCEKRLNVLHMCIAYLPTSGTVHYIRLLMVMFTPKMTSGLQQRYIRLRHASVNR